MPVGLSWWRIKKIICIGKGLSNPHGILLIRLGSANRVYTVVMYQNRIDYGNIDSLVVEEPGNWFIIAACVLHDNLSLARKSFQEFSQFPEFAFGVSYLKR